MHVNQKALYPYNLAEDSLESLFAAHGPLRPWISWLAFAGISALLVALPIVKVDISVRAAGMVRPASERVEIRPEASGHIDEVLVHDNDKVITGQPLIIMSSRDVQERLARNRALQREKGELIDDLDGLTTIVRASANAETLAHNVSPKTQICRQDLDELLSQLESNTVEENKAQKEVWRYSTLAEKGASPTQVLDNARFEDERLKKASQLIVAQALLRWQTLLRDEKTSLADLKSEERRFLEEQRQYTLRAPVNGVLIGFDGWSAGGFVASGQTLGAISPEDSLLVETHVAARDIGQIRVGQKARMQIDAFHYTQWGTLDGTVESISGDMISNPSSEHSSTSNQVYFKVIIRPEHITLTHSNGVRADLRKGMTLSARFLVARRTLLQILYEDVSSSFDPKAAPI
jgi:membrane fusion protein, peptide pheromone/bacteriocin exporter